MTIAALARFVERAHEGDTCPRILLKLVGEPQNHSLTAVDEQRSTFCGKIRLWIDLIFHRNAYKLKEITHFLLHEMPKFSESDQTVVEQALSILDRKIVVHDRNHPHRAINVILSKACLAPRDVTLESSFFEAMHSNAECHRFMQMVVNNDLGKMRAGIIVDYYVNYKKQQDASFCIQEQQRKLLKRLLKKQMEYDEPGRLENTISFNGKVLRVLATRGDGSCALHALLGTANGSGVYECDAKQARKQFTEWLLQKHEQNRLPDEIQIVLQDIFRHFDQAPRAVRNSCAKDYIAENMPGYDKLTQRYDELPAEASYKTLAAAQVEEIKAEKSRINAERDRILNDFISNRHIFAAYLESLNDCGQWLLQEELICASKCFNINIQLVQKGWGDDTNAAANTTHMVNPHSDEVVCIFYRGMSHYARAKVI